MSRLHVSIAVVRETGRKLEAVRINDRLNDAIEAILAGSRLEATRVGHDQRIASVLVVEEGHVPRGWKPRPCLLHRFGAIQAVIVQILHHEVAAEVFLAGLVAGRIVLKRRGVPGCIGLLRDAVDMIVDVSHRLAVCVRLANFVTRPIVGGADNGIGEWQARADDAIESVVGERGLVAVQIRRSHLVTHEIVGAHSNDLVRSDRSLDFRFRSSVQGIIRVRMCDAAGIDLGSQIAPAVVRVGPSQVSDGPIDLDDALLSSVDVSIQCVVDVSCHLPQAVGHRLHLAVGHVTVDGRLWCTLRTQIIEPLFEDLSIQSVIGVLDVVRERIPRLDEPATLVKSARDAIS